MNITFITFLSGLPTALAPLSEIAFVLQLAGVGSAVGSLVALRRRPERAARITAAWAALGLVAGLLVLVVQAAVALLS